MTWNSVIRPVAVVRQVGVTQWPPASISQTRTQACAGQKYSTRKQLRKRAARTSPGAAVRVGGWVPACICLVRAGPRPEKWGKRARAARIVASCAGRFGDMDGAARATRRPETVVVRAGGWGSRVASAVRVQPSRSRLALLRHGGLPRPVRGFRGRFPPRSRANLRRQSAKPTTANGREGPGMDGRIVAGHVRPAVWVVSDSGWPSRPGRSAAGGAVRSLLLFVPCRQVLLLPPSTATPNAACGDWPASSTKLSNVPVQ